MIGPSFTAATEDSAGTDAATGEMPLFVDLDGTLIATDVFYESLISICKLPPKLLLRVPGWIVSGRAVLKQTLAEHVTFDPKRLPYREEVVEFVAAERGRGRPIVLATGTARRWADQVAEHLGLFDDVLSSDGIRNLKGPQKLRAIEDYCRERGHANFAYMGDAFADLPVWQKAAGVYVIEPNGSLLSAVRAIREPTRVFGHRRSPWKALLRVIRPQQWVKNVLLFAPLVLAHRLTDLPRLFAAIWAFVAFSFFASSVYVLNDLLDIQADREHPRKRHRPFAAAALPLMWGPPLTLGLLGAGLLAAASLPTEFTLVLLMYLASTSLYSFWFKRKALVDVISLAGLYTLRIWAGSVAVDVPISEWFTALSLFLFTSLAFVKRYTELSRLANKEGGIPRGRGYRLGDMRFLESAGATCGYLAVLVLALYINDADVKLYPHHRLLWLVCPLMLYWISRLWLLATRGELHDDPVVFAVTDRISLATGAVVAFLAILASATWI